MKMAFRRSEGTPSSQINRCTRTCGVTEDPSSPLLLPDVGLDDDVAEEVVVEEVVIEEDETLVVEEAALLVLSSMLRRVSLPLLPLLAIISICWEASASEEKGPWPLFRDRKRLEGCTYAHLRRRMSSNFSSYE